MQNLHRDIRMATLKSLRTMRSQIWITGYKSGSTSFLFTTDILDSDIKYNLKRFTVIKSNQHKHGVTKISKR